MKVFSHEREKIKKVRTGNVPDAFDAADLFHTFGRWGVENRHTVVRFLMVTGEKTWLASCTELEPYASVYLVTGSEKISAELTPGERCQGIFRRNMLLLHKDVTENLRLLLSARRTKAEVKRVNLVRLNWYPIVMSYFCDITKEKTCFS